MSLGGGDSIGKTFGAPPLKIWEIKKLSKFGAIWDNFQLWSRISLESIKVSTSGKWHYQQDSCHIEQKKWWTSVR